MLNVADLPRLKGYRFPRWVIGYAVWAYNRFNLSLRDAEALALASGRFKWRWVGHSRPVPTQQGSDAVLLS